MNCPHCGHDLVTVGPLGGLYPLVVYCADGGYWYARYDHKTGGVVPYSPYEARARRRRPADGLPRCCSCCRPVELPQLTHRPEESP